MQNAAYWGYVLQIKTDIKIYTTTLITKESSKVHMRNIYLKPQSMVVGLPGLWLFVSYKSQQYRNYLICIVYGKSLTRLSYRHYKRYIPDNSL